MSLRDEINSFRNPQIPENAYSDDEVFNQLVNVMYENQIKEVVKQYFQNNPSASSFSTEINFVNLARILPDETEFNRYINGSNIYAKCDETSENFRYICFTGGFFKFERKGTMGKNKIIYITPLGERVYKALQELALKDGIVFEGLKASYYCEFNSWSGKTTSKTIYPPLGEWFAGKDPDHWKNHSGGHVCIVISFSI